MSNCTAKCFQLIELFYFIYFTFIFQIHTLHLCDDSAQENETRESHDMSINRFQFNEKNSETQ